MTTTQDLQSITSTAAIECAHAADAAQAALCRLESRFDFADLAILSQHFPLSRLWSVMVTVTLLSLVLTVVIGAGKRRTPPRSLDLTSINVFTTLSLLLLVIAGVGAYPIAWSVILLPAGLWVAMSIGINGGHAIALMGGAVEESLSALIAAGIHRAQAEMTREKLPPPLQALAKARSVWKPHASIAELTDPAKETTLERAYQRWKHLPRWYQVGIGGFGLFTVGYGIQTGQPLALLLPALVIGGLWQGYELGRKAEAARPLNTSASDTPAPMQQ